MSDPTVSNVIALRNVSKVYSGGEGAPERPVLNDVSFSLSAGEALAVVGPSGCGKSTLLNIMGLLDEPSTGEVSLLGCPVDRLAEPERADLRARHIGFVFQLHHLLPQLTVLENVLLPTLALPKDARPAESEARGRAESLLQRVGLIDLRHRRPATLSGGERQRTAIVRALINAPQLLLADEPTGALDNARAHDLMRLLDELRASTGVALVVVTHAPELVAHFPRKIAL